MTAKPYRIYINRKPYDYTYDLEAGIVRIRPPGMSESITTQSPTSDEAHNDVRGLLEKALGITARRTAERTQFLRDILCRLAEGGLGFGCGDFVDRRLTKPIEDGGEYLSVTVWYPDGDDNEEHIHIITEDRIATALAKVNNAVTEEKREALDISEHWRRKIAKANADNDGAMIDPPDAASLAEISVFGKIIYE